MPRLKNKPLVLDEAKFIDWLLEVYYFRMMDTGMSAGKTYLILSLMSDEARLAFLQQVRSQLVNFELTFPLGKLPGLYAQAVREISVRPGKIQTQQFPAR